MFVRLIAIACGLLIMANARAAPDLGAYQGQCFSASVPQGWRASETPNGLEIIAPDGVTGTVFTLLLGAFGQTTPRDYLRWRLQSGPYVNPQIEAIRDLPDQPGVMGYNWKVVEATVRFGYQGVPVRAHVVAGVIQGLNQYSAALRAYQSPVDRWDSLEPLLVRVDTSIVVTNAQALAGAPQMHLPKGIRHDEIYGNYNKGYQQRQERQNAWSQQQWEKTSGQVRMKDPATGELYTLPQDTYNAGRGGYVNPKRPTELLEPAEAGE